MDITLDDFFAGRVQLSNLAAQIGTEQVLDEDAETIWAGVPYGSTVALLMSRPYSAVAIRGELERALEIVGLAGEVKVEGETGQVNTIGAQLAIDEQGVVSATS